MNVVFPNFALDPWQVVRNRRNSNCGRSDLDDAHIFHSEILTMRNLSAELIRHHIEKRFPAGHPAAIAKREYVIALCAWFESSGLADRKFVRELASSEEPKFWACISEALVADRLRNKEFGERERLGAGPDFLVMDGSRKIWIEVICPQPIDIPEEWLRMGQLSSGNVEMIEFPHEKILLRWTHAINLKAEKLVGKADDSSKGYINAGIVGPDDAYVIAVNGCLLRNGPFPELCGISGHPFAAEAVFPFGARSVKYRMDNFKTVSQGHQHRPHVLNKNDAKVPTYMFQNSRFNAISAIWAMDIKGGAAIGRLEPIVVIHNPNAKNPVKQGFLDADSECVMAQEGDRFVLRKTAGRRQRQRLYPIYENKSPVPRISAMTKVPRKYRRKSQYWMFQ